MDISIHALLAESDYDNGNPVAVSDLFLSTLSLRRATSASDSLSDTSEVISIHALLAESDRLCEYCERTGVAFLSTLSLRRATKE